MAHNACMIDRITSSATQMKLVKIQAFFEIDQAGIEKIWK